MATSDQTEEAQKPAKKKREKMLIPIDDEEFFPEIGRIGGNATKRNQPQNYFSEIAKLRHKYARERAAGAAGAKESGPSK